MLNHPLTPSPDHRYNAGMLQDPRDILAYLAARLLLAICAGVVLLIWWAIGQLL